MIGFLHARQDPKYAELMVASVRKHMDEPIIQWTDEDTPKVTGVDEVIRKPWNGQYPMLLKMLFLSESEDVIALDTDVIVQANLSPIMALPFDVALTKRDGPIWDEQRNDITKIMPYNCGVLFSKSRDFWFACIEWCRENDALDWYADQLAVANVKTFNVLTLHCDNFNYTPYRKTEDVSKRLAVHYKGNRKEWMLG